jgi:signal transduction histidine kinase
LRIFEGCEHWRWDAVSGRFRIEPSLGAIPQSDICEYLQFPSFPNGYERAVWTGSRFTRESLLQVTSSDEFSHAGIPHNLPKEISLCLFRVLQEAMQNAVKHSGKRYFKAELLGTSGEIQLFVRDSGVGFDQQDGIDRRGLGLISMRERMRLVGGEFSIESRAGYGTTIRARVPHVTEKHRACAAG